MKESDFDIELESPSVGEYCQLRSAVGWESISEEMAECGLKNSLFHITIRKNSKLIAMARVVGDGALFFYVQDVIVHPSFQNLGLGEMLMAGVEEFISKNSQKGATVGLLAAQGKEEFYSRYGYIERTGNPLGKGMCKFI